MCRDSSSKYGRIGDAIELALRAYVADVRAGAFPSAEHTYPMPDDERQKFEQT